MAEQCDTFLSFTDEDLAKFVAEKLKANDIRFVIEKSKPLLDTSLVDTSLDQNIHIKLQRVDFQKGHKVLEDYYKAQIDQVDNGYFLFFFTDEELREIISKPDEWGHFNYQLAQKILKERGYGIDDTELVDLKEERIKDLAQPERAGRLLLFFGYCFIPFGIIVGFLIGRHLFYSRRTLPNGQMVFYYTDADRRHGNRIMIISGVIFILSILVLAIVTINES